MKKKLADVKFLNSIRVDRQENYFRSDIYDIELDNPFIHVTHKTSKRSGISSVYNMVDCHFLDEEAVHVTRKKITKVIEKPDDKV